MMSAEVGDDWKKSCCKLMNYRHNLKMSRFKEP